MTVAEGAFGMVAMVAIGVLQWGRNLTVAEGPKSGKGRLGRNPHFNGAAT